MPIHTRQAQSCGTTLSPTFTHSATELTCVTCCCALSPATAGCAEPLAMRIHRQAGDLRPVAHREQLVDGIFQVDLGARIGGFALLFIVLGTDLALPPRLRRTQHLAEHRQRCPRDLPQRLPCVHLILLCLRPRGQSQSDNIKLVSNLYPGTHMLMEATGDPCEAWKENDSHTLDTSQLPNPQPGWQRALCLESRDDPALGLGESQHSGRSVQFCRADALTSSMPQHGRTSNYGSSPYTVPQCPPRGPSP